MNGDDKYDCDGKDNHTKKTIIAIILMQINKLKYQSRIYREYLQSSWSIYLLATSSLRMKSDCEEVCLESKPIFYKYSVTDTSNTDKLRFYKTGIAL
ncbi:Hypothetical predicted protein [Octopus vulgaris]|uniref:Uncharacterized protein n=1 Tax=Octopus vulgaris TaxID=6645 RepID=A0AA36AYI2_OCTVU|nr:Hypothetical predicted protein [Octopus vulgaris]